MSLQFGVIDVRWNDGAAVSSLRTIFGVTNSGTESFGASVPLFVTPEFVRRKSPAAARSSRPTSTTPKASR